MLEIINKVIWAIATSLIIFTSLYFSFKLKFLQFNVVEIIKSLFKKNKTEEITPISILMLTLAGRIGVGSIAGIALCIYIGGMGSIFWLWVMTLLSSILTYSETVLGNLYKERDNDIYRGGPSYYINKGLKQKRLGIIYSILIIISYIGCFLSIQTNTITKSLNQIIKTSPLIIALFIIIITSIVIFGGIMKISKITNKIVPIMSFLYLIITFYIIIINLKQIPLIFNSIVLSAFNFKSFSTGFMTSLIVGIQRSIFATEAGLGTTSIASSISNINCVKQGYIQIFGVYITSLIICTSTVFVILTSNYSEYLINDLNGIELINYSFNYHLGNIGNIFTFISIFFFAFSTILTGYYYGESSLKYLVNNKVSILILRLFTLLMLFLGCISSSNLLWEIVDIFVGILAIINIYAIFNLKQDIIDETNCYKFTKYDKL